MALQLLPIIARLAGDAALAAVQAAT